MKRSSSGTATSLSPSPSTQHTAKKAKAAASRALSTSSTITTKAATAEAGLSTGPPVKKEDKETHTYTPTPKPTPTTTKGKIPRGAGGVNGDWTPDKRERFMDVIIGMGMKSVDLDHLSQEFGVSKLQIRNATQAGRKGNFRDKACKAVRGD